MPPPLPGAQIIAHRGASGHLPENTIPAFDLALELGADVLELDLRATADGELVTLHDATLQRTAGDARRIDELTSAAVAALDHPGRPVPLDAVLERYGRRTRYLLDLKDPLPAWEGLVLDALARHDLTDRCVVQSFDLAALARLNARAPDVELGVLYRRVASIELRLADVPAFARGVGPWHGVVDAAFMAGARARGLAVRPWTIDSRWEARRLAALGAAGLVTNLPDMVASAVRARRLVPAAA